MLGSLRFSRTRISLVIHTGYRVHKWLPYLVPKCTVTSFNINQRVRSYTPPTLSPCHQTWAPRRTNPCPRFPSSGLQQGWFEVSSTSDERTRVTNARRYVSAGPMSGRGEKNARAEKGKWFVLFARAGDRKAPSLSPDDLGSVSSWYQEYE